MLVKDPVQLVKIQSPFGAFNPGIQLWRIRPRSQLRISHVEVLAEGFMHVMVVLSEVSIQAGAEDKAATISVSLLRVNT